MREEFFNSLQENVIFDDNGITFHNSKYSMKSNSEHQVDNCMCPYGSITKIKFSFGSLMVDFMIKGEKYFFTFMVEGTDKKRMKSLIDFANNLMQNSPKTDGINLDSIKEHRMLCNTCQKVFCYTDEDLRKNDLNSRLAKNSNNRAIGEALGGTRIMSQLNSNASEMYKNQIIDYSKCPYCNSANIAEISEEEWQNINNKSEATTNTMSAADEIKKFKDLLDNGIITQEEFDEKKKQLLGL